MAAHKGTRPRSIRTTLQAIAQSTPLKKAVRVNRSAFASQDKLRVTSRGRREGSQDGIMSDSWCERDRKTHRRGLRLARTCLRVLGVLGFGHDVLAPSRRAR